MAHPNLGKMYRDMYTGWEGVATSRYEHLNGCVQYSLERVVEGKIKNEYFDVQRLINVETDEPLVDLIEAPLNTPQVPELAPAGGPHSFQYKERN